jgi:hypothetical protein
MTYGALRVKFGLNAADTGSRAEFGLSFVAILAAVRAEQRGFSTADAAAVARAVDAGSVEAPSAEEQADAWKLMIADPIGHA